MLYNTLTLYHIIVGICRATPRVIEPNGYERRCNRIQTFAVTNDWEAAATSDTFGKDVRHVGKEVFYSSLWDGTGQSPSRIGYSWYPTLLLGSQSERVEDTRFGVAINYSIVFIDKCDEAQGGNPPQTTCDTRTAEEVENDLRRLYLQFRADINDVVLASLTSTTTPSASFENTWVSRGWLDEYELADPTATIQIHNELSDFVSFNSEAIFTKEPTASDTYSYVTTMSVLISDCTTVRAKLPPVVAVTGLLNLPCC